MQVSISPRKCWNTGEPSTLEEDPAVMLFCGLPLHNDGLIFRRTPWFQTNIIRDSLSIFFLI